MISTLTNLKHKSVRLADLNNNDDIEYILTVLDNYKTDGMGESPPYSKIERLNLIKKFKSYPKIYIFLAFVNNKIAGGAVCFNTFSTFTTKDVLNIHDICVIKDFRGFGLGRDIMNSIIEQGIKINCGKITLEVREDNIVAQTLYSSLDFGEAIPVMKFWSKYL